MMIPHPIRVPLRTAEFCGLTFAFLAGFETELRATRGERDRIDVTYKWMQRYGKGLCAIYGLDVIARGKFVDRPWGRYPARDEQGMGRLYVQNHRSMFDVFVDLAFLEHNTVTRADLAHWPVIGLAARRTGTLFVDRSSKQSGAAVINAMCTGVETGRAVMTYAEGTTFSGDEVRPFRPGAFLAAQRTGAEIVPVGIAYDGENSAYVEEPFVQHLFRVTSAKRTRVGLVVGDPIKGPHPDVSALRDEARARVQDLVHEARRLLR